MKWSQRPVSLLRYISLISPVMTAVARRIEVICMKQKKFLLISGFIVVEKFPVRKEHERMYISCAFVCWPNYGFSQNGNSYTISLRTLSACIFHHSLVRQHPNAPISMKTVYRCTVISYRNSWNGVVPKCTVISAFSIPLSLVRLSPLFRRVYYTQI